MHLTIPPRGVVTVLKLPFPLKVRVARVPEKPIALIRVDIWESVVVRDLPCQARKVLDFLVEDLLKKTLIKRARHFGQKGLPRGGKPLQVGILLPANLEREEVHKCDHGYLRL